MSDRSARSEAAKTSTRAAERAARGLAILQQEPAPSDNVLDASMVLPNQGEGTRVAADHRRWYKPNQSSRARSRELKSMPDEHVGTPRAEDAIQELENSLLTKPVEEVVEASAGASSVVEVSGSAHAILETTASTTEKNDAEQPEPSSVVAVAPRVESGTVTIIHSIKHKEFAVSCPPGAVAVAELDDRFCFPFAFKPGTYTIRLRTTDPNVTDDPGDLLHPQLPLTPTSTSQAESSALSTSATNESTMRSCVTNASNENNDDSSSSSVYCTSDEDDPSESDPRVILGVKLGCTYWCDIKEHDGADSSCGKGAPSKRIFKADPDQREPTRIANPDKAGVAALSLGEDKASCSCLEGRFDVMASACFNYVLCHLPGRHRLLTRLP